MKRLLFLFAICLFLFSERAYAIKTASSFDVSWGIANLSLNTTDGAASRTLTSPDALQIDYNVALFDYRTVASLSFMQLETSSLGPMPLSRIALGVSYHFFRINGQRIVLDNQVEGKVWGISPALELSLGISKISINDPENSTLHFTASAIDAIPRFLVEVPISSTFLLMLRAGYYTTLSSSNQYFNVKLSGSIFNVGFKLTTL